MKLSKLRETIKLQYKCPESQEFSGRERQGGGGEAQWRSKAKFSTGSYWQISQNFWWERFPVDGLFPTGG